MSKPTEFRWVCGKRTGSWHPTIDAAQSAAVRQGLGTWEAYEDQQGKRRFYAGPLTKIERR